jgi:nucleoside-diphosphate-sugar epimerase
VRIAITGHTHGLGLALFNHFSGSHEVIGMSRSTGHDLSTHEGQDKIAAEAAACDVFFNNAYAECAQATLLARLYTKTQVVTSGSMAGVVKAQTNNYQVHKHRLEFVHEQIRSMEHRKPVLLLRMGFLENFPQANPITYDEVISAVEFWLSNPRVTLMEFANTGIPKEVLHALAN